jgi:soluble lytic murein transglycosylase-like protein
LFQAELSAMTDDDRTVLIPSQVRPEPGPAPIEVVFSSGRDARRTEHFTEAFTIGRGEDCAVHIADAGVSRHHVEVYPDNGTWWLRDLESSNGSFVADRRVTTLPIQGVTTVVLGHDGPRIRLVAPVPPPPPTDTAPSLEHISERYFGDTQSEAASDQTIMIRQAFQQSRRKHSNRYRVLIGFVLLLLLAVGGFAFVQYIQLKETSKIANDIFYDMKEVELQIVNLEASLDDATAAVLKDQIAASKRKLANMRERYEAFVEKIQQSRPIALDSADLLILHTARVFGETEIDVPDDFVDEVKKYIKKWQSSSRLANAINRLDENNYAPMIVNALTSNGLPPQFMYVALQETNFQARAVGPPTRYGRAKGMWQFIPSTGKRYGLKPGPLKALGKYDPDDDRHDVGAATAAAARYLADIYRTDAQASGLLVMASYNWGEGNIIKRIRKMPENPKERNFWELLRRYKIPKETYDYVFYIFAAAVICENPTLFGFDFENPLLQIPVPGPKSISKVDDYDSNVPR